MNLVNLKSSSVTGNHIRNAGYGITLWSHDGHGVGRHFRKYGGDCPATRGIASSWGIATYYDADFNGDFSDLQITGNIVQFEQESSSRTISGSANYGIGLQALANISNAFILGNEIASAPVRGIAVGVSTGGTRLTRVYSGQSDRGCGIECVTRRAALFRRHQRAGQPVPRSMSFGIAWISSPTRFIGRYSYWSFETGYTFTNVVVAENYATATHGSPTNGLTASDDSGRIRRRWLARSQ